MRWFHHDCESHRDPFIQWLLDNEPRYGYQTFFIILEMISERFKPKKKEDAKEPIILKISTIMDATRIKKRQKLEKLLSTFATHSLNKRQWKVKYLDNDMNGYVQIYIPKLIEDADTYTKNKVGMKNV